jgi:hypothetical protein
MPYDPCGTQRLEGDEIMRRLAKELGTNAATLRKVLLDLISKETL